LNNEKQATHNSVVSNHHGATVPNITAGFDRTFGPAYYYFNHGSKTSSLSELRTDALKLAAPTWNTEFYNAIAQYVPGYLAPVKRATFRGKFELPANAKNGVAILSVTGIDVQDNAAVHDSHQYWSKIGADGTVEIPMVVPGTYRLTIYADGIFGEYSQDNIEIKDGGVTTPTVAATWKEATSGKEIWRIGTPDHSAGEYRHGFIRDTGHTQQPEEYRIVWLNYDFAKDFPGGVRFKIGQSKEAHDWNYVHWSEFGGVGGENVSDWRILWDQKSAPAGKATFTVQLAGVKTASGNSHVIEDGKVFPNLPFDVAVNGKKLETWEIPYVHPSLFLLRLQLLTPHRYYHSSSCAIRSGIACYNTAHKFVFDAALLKEGQNEFVLSLPAGGKVKETAQLAGQFYVQYDALKLEIA
jgi:rhamnogalacturonan endolyase